MKVEEKRAIESLAVPLKTLNTGDCFFNLNSCNDSCEPGILMYAYMHDKDWDGIESEFYVIDIEDGQIFTHFKPDDLVVPLDTLVSYEFKEKAND